MHIAAIRGSGVYFSAYLKLDHGYRRYYRSVKYGKVLHFELASIIKTMHLGVMVHQVTRGMRGRNSNIS